MGGTLGFTWLHISDFHLKGGDPYDSEVVLKSLIQSVKAFRDGGRRPDLIFATGDVVQAGKAAEYERATAFFDGLCDAAGVDRKHLFVVPGNHDVDRDRVKFLQRSLRTEDESVAYFQPGSSKVVHLEGQLAFLDWYDSYFKGLRRHPRASTCGPVECVDVRGFRVGVVPLNSALFCRDDHDHSELWIGRRCLDDALEQLSTLGAQFRVAMMHHPLDWLHDRERSSIKAKLAANVDLVLRGHLHDSEVELVRTPVGPAGVLHLAAGAAYQTRLYPNRALYGAYDDGQVRILPIRYEDSPTEVWTVDPSLFPYEPGHEGRMSLERPTSAPGLAGSPAGKGAQAGGFWHDVFVSCCDEDDRGAQDGAGWLGAFVTRLRGALASFLNRATNQVRIYRSSSPSAADLAQMERSATIVIVGSAAYAESGWCQPIAGDVLRRMSAHSTPAFVVERSPADAQEWPATLLALERFRFWGAGTAGGGTAVPLDMGAAEGMDPRGDGRLSDLAQRLGEEIEHPGRWRSERNGRPTVFLAEVTDELEVRRDQVRRYLDQAHLNVRPTSAGRASHALTLRPWLEEEIGHCVLFVQLLGPDPGKGDASAPVGLPRLQHACAVAANVPIVQWKPTDLDVSKVADPQYQDLLRLETVYKQSLPEFCKDVVTRAEREGRPEPKGPAGAARTVFVDFENDGRKPDAVFRAIKQLKGTYVTSPRSSKAEWRTFIKNTDGVLLIHGGNGTWTARRYLDCKQILGLAKRDLGAVAIYNGPAPDKSDDLPVGGDSVFVIESPAALDTGALATFLGRLSK